MRLKKLELFGFKSFGKKTELVFDVPVTVVVGPNGSGKSNIAEAMRFVLGEQSLKSMRGKRGEDLIWNGSADAPRQARASVTVTLDNSDRIFSSLDYDEVILRRVVHRDGVNQYFINNSLVRLKDIIELLACVHIGASSHHIISQGEADRILNASIKDRRGMIEDALGLKIYHYKKAESEKKLAKTDENMKEVGLLRRELAPHLKFLKKQVERLEKARDTRDELTEKYRVYFAHESTYVRTARADLVEERRGPQERGDEIAQALANVRESASQAADDDGKLGEIMECERTVNRIRTEYDTASRELGRLEGIIEYQMREAERRAHQETHIPFREVRTLSQDIYDRLETIEASGDLSFVKKSLKMVRDTIADFVARYRFGGHESDADVRPADIQKLKQQTHALKQTIEEKESLEQEVRDRVEALRHAIAKEKDHSRLAERQLFELMNEETKIRARLADITARETALTRDEEELKRELGEAVAIVGRGATEFESYGDASDVSQENRDAQRERRRMIEKLKIRLEEYGSGRGEEISKEYKEMIERDQFLERELKDLEVTAHSLRGMILNLEERLDTEFKDGVKKINEQFQEFFSMLFGGGSVSLEIVRQQKRKRAEMLLDEIDTRASEEIEPEMEEGLEISLTLPRKKIRGLQMLSGGERALTSVALLFSVSQVNPPPFMVLDETDAALDEANSEKYGHMIRALSKKSQLVVITHNRGTMAHAGVLYGVTMGADGVSKIISIKFDEATEMVE